MVAACSASSTGLCHGSTSTAVPSRKRRGARRHPGEQVEARRHLAEAGEMMLDHEARRIAERLRLDVVVDEVAKARAEVEVWPAALRLRRAEQSEFHGMRYAV